MIHGSETDAITFGADFLFTVHLERKILALKLKRNMAHSIADTGDAAAVLTVIICIIGR